MLVLLPHVPVTRALSRPRSPKQIDTEQLWKFTTLERCVRYHLQARPWVPWSCTPDPMGT